MTDEKPRFYIRAHYSFYPDSRAALKDGAIRGEDGKRLSFDTRYQAILYLRDVLGCERYNDGSWAVPGQYVCSAEEYSKPVYKIRKVRVKVKL